ncbi:MAG: GapR family DNA-binding domain-containing protein [bacterium]
MNNRLAYDFIETSLSDDDIRQLKAYIRILELIEKRKIDLQIRSKKIYEEVKSCGFDVQAVRAIINEKKDLSLKFENKKGIISKYKSILLEK